jgi:SAM-dependent methyltransferase
MSAHGQLANEQRGVAEILAEIPGKRRWAATVMARLRRVAPLPERPQILDVGAAGGGFAVACAQLGWPCVGVEPWEPARRTAADVAAHAGVEVRMLAGSAEALPICDAQFDVVHASSVIEHVARLDDAIAEIRRVLRPGGAFWFNAASALCPMQEEITGFPLFGWYPDRVKRSIMAWARDERPQLVAFSRTPAVNWFTPRRARALLARHGFTRVFDRWDLRGDDEGGAAYRVALRAIRTSRPLRFAADLALSGCSFAAL